MVSYSFGTVEQVILQHIVLYILLFTYHKQQNNKKKAFNNYTLQINVCRAYVAGQNNTN